ncbi:TetR/AcrR family transcriptional regulator [Streptomyces sp. ISL-43]|uniref:TetR/AcrR family transcriptional regulator n=1 Tax=Streptomyces sp. ISL-43 TaxID=2819183 RepID=UPI001BE88308|nr:TetR/AcrR family transcriptional regulator [Streptomyces sp. ISL-43]MBT2449215.1 TetR/AcrR family transcriptional regulator [Streptomyces sp. ISL-43]
MDPERAARLDNIRTPHGRYAKGVRRRNEILAVALEVFAMLGEKGALIKEIADRMGMSQAGVLRYFGSREGLLIWALAERDRLAKERIAQESYGDPISPMAATLRRSGDVAGLVRLYVSMAAASGFPDHPARDFFEVRNGDILIALRDGLAELQHEGRIRPDIAPDAIARLALAAADGIQHQWLLDPTVDMGGVIDTIVALVVDVTPSPEASAVEVHVPPPS